MATFTLDSIREAADAKYGALEIERDGKPTVRFENPLRLGQKKREEMMALQDSLKDKEGSVEKVDQAAVMRQMLLCAATNEKHATEMLDEIGEDLAVLVSLVEAYGEGTKSGEASPSQD